jgi:ATP-dependent Clp protease ATP-binding subunit ClpC
VPITLKNARQLEGNVRKDKEEALSTQQYEYAAELRERETQIQDKIKGMEKEWQEEQDKESIEVTAEDIAEVISMWTNIPVVQLAEEESSRLLHMEEALHKRIVGQDEAITSIAKAVRRARAGLKDPRHPIGNFVFLGPTGVGKTELVRALAEFMFGSEDSLIRLDMSEFMEKHTVARLVGAPPGYIGYEEGGQLTEAVRRKSYCAILLDEIEKAHPDVFNILLQIFDDGHLTDAKGRRVDFRNSIIVMTSNIGAELIRKGGTIGFVSHSDEAKAQQLSHGKMKEKLLGEMKKSFRPEFLNRIDGVIVFHSLNKKHIRHIVDLMLATINTQLAEKEIKLEVTDAAKDLLGEKGYDEVFGARPLRRVIQNMVEDKLSEDLLRQAFAVFDPIYVIKAETTETIPAIINAIKQIKGVLNLDAQDNRMTIYCTKDLRDLIEGTIKDHNGLLVEMKMHKYVSKALVDVKDGEIIVKTKEKLLPHPSTVGALSGEKES